MNKLININQRKPHYMSTPNLTLPPIKQHQYQMPLHEESNSIMAKKIINSKPSINMREQLDRYRTCEAHKRMISKYDQNGGASINRKKYLAELLLLKKLKSSRVLNPEIWWWIILWIIDWFLMKSGTHGNFWFVIIQLTYQHNNIMGILVNINIIQVAVLRIFILQLGIKAAKIKRTCSDKTTLWDTPYRILVFLPFYIFDLQHSWTPISF